jgi:4-deoxy-L-threo-5-hexosulose-uronate ketol-isomerase
MDIRFQNSKEETKGMDTQELRKNFLIEKLVQDNKLKLVYSHYDRVIIGGAKPVIEKLILENQPELRAGYFLERRELGIINIGGAGQVEADGKSFNLAKLDCLYLGKDTREVVFSSKDFMHPAVFYLLSAPAHTNYPNTKYTKEQASPSVMGDSHSSNKRTIYKYIHQKGIQSCQLVMGLTVLENGSVWNTMPAHTHTRRTEVYFYFDVPLNDRIFHFMGEPEETRHILVPNHGAVISPPWSIHSGCGTASYAFIWGMAGENDDYADMDKVQVSELK